VASGGFNWKNRRLVTNIRQLSDDVDGIISDAVEYHNFAAVTYAKVHASWTDRTTNARNGLSALPFHVPKHEHGFTLFHTVSYGIWLEVANSGRYAIIMDTLDREGPELMETIRQAFAAGR
jgi:hypothetical protein